MGKRKSNIEIPFPIVLMMIIWY